MMIVGIMMQKYKKMGTLQMFRRFLCQVPLFFVDWVGG